MSVTVAFLPCGVDPADRAVPMCTVGSYGESVSSDTMRRLHETAARVASMVDPFAATVADRRAVQLPSGDELVMFDQHPAFSAARNLLPTAPQVKDTYTPHVVVSHAAVDARTAAVADTDRVVFDRIVISNGASWRTYHLGVADVTPRQAAFNGLAHWVASDLLSDPEAARVAGLDDIIEGKVGVGGSGRRGRGRRNSKQKCFHGSPATCKSVKWIAVYTALRKKGMTKSKAAAIANSMHNKWKKGIPNRVGQRPMIRKTI